MHRHQLNGVRIGVDGAQLQALLLVVRAFQPGEEAHHVAHAARGEHKAASARLPLLRAHAVGARVNHGVDARGRHSVGGGHLVEGVQVYARHQRVGARADRQLNVQEHGAFNLVEQIAQVVAQARAEHAHLLGEGAQTLQARRGEAAATVVLAVERFAVRAVLRQVLDCLDERNVPRGVIHRALEHLVQLLLCGAQMLGGQTAAGTPAGPLGGAVLCFLCFLEQAQGHLLPQGPLTLANQRLRPVPQRQQVGTTQAPAGTREQAGQRIRTVRVGQHAQRRGQVHDLRLREQAAQAHLLHRNVQALALLANRVQLAVGAGQHGDLGHLQAWTH